MARRSPAGNNRPTHNGSAAAVGLLICLAVGSLAQAQTSATSMARGRAAAREVRAASRALDNALQRRDTAALAKIYSNGYVHIDQFGVRSTKQQRLAELGSGARQVQAIGPIDEIRMEVFGDDVVVSTARTNGRQTLNGTPVGGGPRLSTRVWVRQAGRWQVILAQVTAIAPR